MKELHEYAKFFPPMEGEEFKALCQDVKEHGLINPIVLKDDHILDGRNRARACDEIGVRPKYEELKNGHSPLDYVISQNVLRRHLTPSQRAILALELEKKFAAEPKQAHKVGEPKWKDLTSREKDAKTAAGKAAKALKVNQHLVVDAKRLAKNYPEKIAAVRAGKITVGEALVQGLGSKAKEAAIRDKYRDKMKRLQKDSRQVAEYLAAAKMYIVALKVAMDSIERFSPEGADFATRRVKEIQELHNEFLDDLKKRKSVKEGR